MEVVIRMVSRHKDKLGKGNGISLAHTSSIDIFIMYIVIVRPWSERDSVSFYSI